MKRFNGIVESEFAPASTMDMWLFKGNLKYFGPKGWTDVGSGGGSQELAQVAYTGDYNDLFNLPDIPTAPTPIIIPDTAFNIPANSNSDTIAAVFTDELVSEIYANGVNKRLVLLANNSQQFPISLQYSNSNGNLTIRLMYVHAGMEFYREFKKTAAGVWSIGTVRAGQIMLTTDPITVPVVDNITEGGSTKALSAEQGKVLGDSITTLKTAMRTTPESVIKVAGPDTYGLIKAASSDLQAIPDNAPLSSVIQAVNDIIITLRGINILV